MIRNWVGMVGRQAFYDACDHYGILVWDDFWLANPVDGPDPDDHAMFMANVRDKIRRVRSHASLALYCGRNEGNPPADLDAGMREAVAALDGSRLYIPNSAAGTVTGHGPYEIKDVEWYFANRGKTFHSRTGNRGRAGGGKHARDDARGKSLAHQRHVGGPRLSVAPDAALLRTH